MPVLQIVIASIRPGPAGPARRPMVRRVCPSNMRASNAQLVDLAEVAFPLSDEEHDYVHSTPTGTP